MVTNRGTTGPDIPRHQADNRPIPEWTEGEIEEMNRDELLDSLHVDKGPHRNPPRRPVEGIADPVVIVREIEARSGITIEDVRAVIRKGRLSGESNTRKVKVVEVVRGMNGYNEQAIADVLQCGKSTVYKWRKSESA